MKFPDVSGEGGGIDSKHFVKLKDKESTVGVFRGDPHVFRQHWINKRGILCKGENCEHCASGQKSTFRFRLNFVTRENNIPVAKIFEQGWNVYETLKGLNEADYPLDKTIVRITRNGTDTNTRYTILPIPKYEVTPPIDKEISMVPLHSLDPEDEHKTADQNDMTPVFDSDIPF